MTTSIVRILHCDFPDCDARIEDDLHNKLYVQDRPDGWTNAIHTHGCPDHGEVIAAHKADVTSRTSGRGSREKTTWYLACACGWSPTPNRATHSAAGLKDQHVKHVADVTG